MDGMDFRSNEHVLRAQLTSDPLRTYRFRRYAQRLRLDRLKGALVVTITTILIETDALRNYPSFFSVFTAKLCSIAAAPADLAGGRDISYLRQCALEALRELEDTEPGLLHGLVADVMGIGGEGGIGRSREYQEN